MIGVDSMCRNLWFELDNTGKLIIVLTLLACILLWGLNEFIDWIRGGKK